MKIDCGIIGLPNVGKSTFFNILTNIPVKIANFPFSTIHPNIAKVYIPDSRVYQIAKVMNSRKVIYDTINFIDIAGLIKGASQGEGLGNEILSHIRSSKILCHIVRCFDDPNIYHVSGYTNPIEDLNILNTELILFDISECEKYLNIIKKSRKNINFDNERILILEKCLSFLYKGIFLRKVNFSQLEIKNIQTFNLLTFKSIIYIANINSKSINKFYLDKLKTIASYENIPIILFYVQSLTFDVKLNDYDSDRKKIELNREKFLKEVFKNIFSVLKLHTFFTANLNVAKSWIDLIGISALDAANRVHSEFKTGFIRVQVIKFEDLITCGGELQAKKLGKVYFEGKKYLIRDSDVLRFLFNTR